MKTSELPTPDQLDIYAGTVWLPNDLIEIRCLPVERGALQPVSRWIRAGDLPAQSDELLELNRQGYGIFAGALPRLAPGGMKDSDCGPGYVIWADLDGVTPRQTWRRIENAGLPKPTCIVASGHGSHAYFGLTEAATPGDISDVVALLAEVLQSDRTVRNPSRILRLPGFENHKPPPAPCHLLHAEICDRYAIGDLLEALHNAPQAAQATPEPAPVPNSQEPAAIAPGPPTAPTNGKLAARARKYASRWEPCAEGERNQAAYRHAAALVNDFDLSAPDAVDILRDWNSRNAPPLDMQELMTAISNAKTYAKNEPGRLAKALKPATGDKTGDKTESPPDSTEIPIASAPGLDVYAEIDAEESGKRQVIPILWGGLGHATNMLRPGQLVILAGPEGSGKSLLAQQIAWTTFKARHMFSFLPLEDAKADWERRAAAFANEKWAMLDLDAHTATERRKMIKRHEAELTAFATGCVENPGTPKRDPETGQMIAGLVSPEAVLDWTRRALEHGRLAVIDNLSQIDFAGGRNQWESEGDFARRLVALAGTGTIILVTHLRYRGPSERGKPLTTDDVQGSKMLCRRAHVVVALESHDEREAKVYAPAGRFRLVTHDKTISVLKARNAPGAGTRLAFTVSAGGRFHECGAIAPSDYVGNGLAFDDDDHDSEMPYSD